MPKGSIPGQINRISLWFRPNAPDLRPFMFRFSRTKMYHIFSYLIRAHPLFQEPGSLLVFIRKDLLAREPVGHVPTMLRYSTHAENDSLYNTPNTFGIMVLRNVLAWVKAQGGATAMGERNQRKADALYALLDESSLYRPHAQPGSRSTMNVTWTLQGDDAEAQTKRFLSEATRAGLSGLKGHRSVGGCRASIYNAFPEEGVKVLCEFMREFERKA